MNWLHCNITDFNEAEYEKAYKDLSLSRKKRIDRLKQPQDKKRSLAASILTERLLHEKYGIENISLENRENGNPFLAGSDLFVSISHCENIVICAIDEKPVGIDIEKIKPINLSIAKRVCVEEEAFYLFGKTPLQSDYCHCENIEILGRFFEIWTAKEAYFKKCGTGITDFKTINILSLKRQIFNIDNNYFVQIVSE